MLSGDYIIPPENFFLFIRAESFNTPPDFSSTSGRLLAGINIKFFSLAIFQSEYHEFNE
jgi:hypothetical protein